MKQKLLHTPQGVRDIYGNECEKKNVIKDHIHHVLWQYGYHDIETPTFEFFDIFNQEKGTVDSSEMYKFFDRNNNTLVLRPDMTPSIARSVAKYYEEETLPLRLSYQGNTYLNRMNYQGKLTEVTQMGAELINEESFFGDAEVIAMMIDCLKAAGLKEFRVDIGQVDFYKGLVEEAGLSEEQEAELRQYIDNKNSFGVEKVLKKLPLRESSYEALSSFMDLYGEREILERAKAITTNEKALKAIEGLEKVYDILCIYGYESYLSFDLGMLTQFNYYTGIIFKGYTYGTGEAVGKGGRYDELLSQFGKKAPSVGFVITIDELMMALSRQQIDISVMGKILLLFEEKDMPQVLKDAAYLRSLGESVALVKKQGKDKMDSYIPYAKANNIKQIYCYTDGQKTRFEITE